MMMMMMMMMIMMIVKITISRKQAINSLQKAAVLGTSRIKMEVLQSGT